MAFALSDLGGSGWRKIEGRKEGSEGKEEGKGGRRKEGKLSYSSLILLQFLHETDSVNSFWQRKSRDESVNSLMLNIGVLS